MSVTVKINEESLKNAESKTREVFKKVIANKALLNEMGNLMVTDIKFQTRRGKSIPNNLQKFKPLSESWVDQRSKLAGKVQVGETYSKRRSNLTFTGQLLDAVSYVVEGAGKVRLRLVGIHRKYTNGGRNIPNAELAVYVAEQGRPFMGVTPQLQSRLKSRVIEYIRRGARVLKAFTVK